MEKDLDEVLKFSYREIYSIFAKHLDQMILTYCIAISKYEITKEFLEDKITYNEDIQKLVEKLDEESKNKFDHRHLNLSEMLYLIPQHIQR